MDCCLNVFRVSLAMQGSVVDRHASEKEKAKDLPTYKDKDFIGDGRVLCVGSDVRQKLLNVFQADTDVIIFFSIGCCMYEYCIDFI